MAAASSGGGGWTTAGVMDTLDIMTLPGYEEDYTASTSSSSSSSVTYVPWEGPQGYIPGTCTSWQASMTEVDSRQQLDSKDSCSIQLAVFTAGPSNPNSWRSAVAACNTVCKAQHSLRSGMVVRDSARGVLSVC